MTQITLAEKLRYLRKSRHMSQVELAHRLGLTNNAFISHLERGTKRPSEAMLRRIAEIFAYDADSLRALVSPSATDARQAELEPAPGADLLAQIRREAGLFGERLSELVAETLPSFLWSREQRAVVESTSQEVWILTPILAYHGVQEDLVRVAAANLQRGVRYRYLIADAKESRIEMGRMFTRYQAPGQGKSKEGRARTEREQRLVARHEGRGGKSRTVRAGAAPAATGNDDENMPLIGLVPPASFPFIFEAAIFDPADSERIRGSVVSPAARGDWEIVLTRDQTTALAGHFARWWERFA